jgi:hypothetical protein
MSYKPFKEIVKGRVIETVQIQEKINPAFSFGRAKFKRAMKIEFNDPNMFRVKT